LFLKQRNIIQLPDKLEVLSEFYVPWSIIGLFALRGHVTSSTLNLQSL